MYSYTWQDAITLVNKISKGTPLGGQDTHYCDLVSGEVAFAYPWREFITTIATGTLPLADGVQDYSAPPQIYRLLRMWLRRTDTTPAQVIDIKVAQHLTIDLVSRSYDQIRAISLDEGVGRLRLESAVQIPSSITLELGGEFQRNPDKVTALTQNIWFSDHYYQTAIEGLLYWVYKIGDDPRAGGVAMQEDGTIAYSGQYAKFRAHIDLQARAEDFGPEDSFFPDDNLGAGRDGGSQGVSGFVFGS